MGQIAAPCGKAAAQIVDTVSAALPGAAYNCLRAQFGGQEITSGVGMHVEEYFVLLFQRGEEQAKKRPTHLPGVILISDNVRKAKNADSARVFRQDGRFAAGLVLAIDAFVAAGAFSFDGIPACAGAINPSCAEHDECRAGLPRRARGAQIAIPVLRVWGGPVSWIKREIDDGVRGTQHPRQGCVMPQG